MKPWLMVLLLPKGLVCTKTLIQHPCSFLAMRRNLDLDADADGAIEICSTEIQSCS